MEKEYTIKGSIKLGSYQGKFGEMYKYGVMFDGETDAVEISQKPDTPAPKEGDKLTGTIETTAYGKRFHKTQTGGKQGYNNDPQRQSSIEWQSARRDAVDYCIAKSRLLFDLKKPKEAEEELSGKHIFEVALYFKGIETGATQLKNKKEEIPEKQVDEIEDRNDDSAKDEMKDDEPTYPEDTDPAMPF